MTDPSTGSGAGEHPVLGIERAAPGEVRIRRALLSVSDKTGLVDFARGLSSWASSSSPPAAPPVRWPTRAFLSVRSRSSRAFPR